MTEETKSLVKLNVDKPLKTEADWDDAIHSLLIAAREKREAERKQRIENPEFQDLKAFKESLFKTIPAMLIESCNNDTLDKFEIISDLSDLLFDSEIDYIQGDTIFNMIYRLIENERDEFIKANAEQVDVVKQKFANLDRDIPLFEQVTKEKAALNRQLQNREFVLQTIDSNASEYCRRTLCLEVGDKDFGNKLMYILRVIDLFGGDSARHPYIIAGAKEARDLFQKELDFRAKYAEIRSKTFEPTIDFDETPTASSKHVAPRDFKQVFLALKMLLGFTNLDGTEADEFMSFLSGYSQDSFQNARQNGKKNFRNWRDKKERFEKADHYIKKIVPRSSAEFRQKISELKRICGE